MATYYVVALDASGSQLTAESDTNTWAIKGDATNKFDVQTDAGVSVFKVDTTNSDVYAGGDVIVPQGNKIHLDNGQEYFESNGTNILVYGAGSVIYTLGQNVFNVNYINGPALRRESSSATNPTVIPDYADNGYGLGGSVSGGYVSLISNSVEGLRITESGGGAIPSYDTTSGITASTTQSQGQQPLVSRINEVSTVANTGDVVTLPSAVSGMVVTVINNGANTLGIFPASGDDNGSGVDTVTNLASGSNVTFAAIDTTTWEAI